VFVIGPSIITSAYSALIVKYDWFLYWMMKYFLYKRSQISVQGYTWCQTDLYTYIVGHILTSNYQFVYCYIAKMFCTQTCNVVKDVCHYIADKHLYGKPPDDTCMFIRKLVEQEIEDYPSLIDISRRLNFRHLNDINQVKEVVEEMFSDGVVNRGRIITLLAFGGLVSHLCTERKLIHPAEIVTNIISVFLLQRLGDWIIRHGGWVSLFLYTHR